MKRVLVILAGVALAAGLAACGEREQVVVYKQGQYQGKRDQQPFSGPPAQNVHLSILPRTPNAPACGNCGAPNGQA